MDVHFWEVWMISSGGPAIKLDGYRTDEDPGNGQTDGHGRSK